MYVLELKDKTTINVSTVSENYRNDFNNTMNMALQIDINSDTDIGELSEFTKRFSADNMATINIYNDEAKTDLRGTFSGYIYPTNFSKKILPACVSYTFVFSNEQLKQLTYNQ